MSARAAILARLRGAAPGVAATAAPALDARIDTHYDTRRASAAHDPHTLAQAMQAALTASHAEVWCATGDAWPAQLAARLAEAGVRRLLLDPARAESAALARALPDAIAPVPFDRPIDAWKNELFDTIDAGFTVARSGIAATGTVVLAPDPGTPRTVSLCRRCMSRWSTRTRCMRTCTRPRARSAGTRACRPTSCWCRGRRKRPTSSRRSPTARTARAACGS